MPISVCLQISWPLINWAEFLLRSRFTILSVRRSELGFRPWNAAWRVGIQCSLLLLVLLLCWQTFPSILRRVRKVLKTTHFICKEEEEVATIDWRTVTIIAALITIFSHHFCHFVWTEVKSVFKLPQRPLKIDISVASSLMWPKTLKNVWSVLIKQKRKLTPHK